mmetsp:Transcript_18570/g.42700  ORF Transcript_18570/g.42700 Transcript_18570/m.42700 type:complete len:325 (+) Transcript_18570:872-1846(+)
MCLCMCHTKGRRIRSNLQGMLRRHLFVRDLKVRMDEIDRRLAVNGGQRVKLGHELGPEFLVVILDEERVAGNDRLGIGNDVGQDQCRIGPRSEQPVVEQSPIVEVLGTHVVRHLEQEASQHALGFRGSRKEDLHRGIEQVLLDANVLEVVVVVDEFLERVGRFVHQIAALSQHPYNAGLTFALLDVPETPGQARAADGFEIGMLSDHQGQTRGGLALDVLHAEIQKVDHALGNRFGGTGPSGVPAGNLGHALDGEPREICVVVVDGFRQFRDNVGRRIRIGQERKDLYLEVLDVCRFAKAGVELAVLVVEGSRAQLHEGLHLLQ